jgi:hypothetical protein
MNEFVWQRPVDLDGFEWAVPPGARAPELVRKADAAFEDYEPLRAGVALHRELARTDPTQAGLLTFVNQYGHLGHRLGNSAIDSSRGEPFKAYQEDIARLRSDVRWWDMVLNDDRAGLGKVFKVPPTEAVLAARQHVLDGINFWMGVELQLAWDSKRSQVVQVLMPSTLYGATYLLFAREVLSLRRPQKCAVCGRFFETAPGRHDRRTRADRETCTGACRNQAYRNRQQRAHHLHAQGATVKAIAKELGSKVETVKAWLNINKG